MRDAGVIDYSVPAFPGLDAELETYENDVAGSQGSLDLGDITVLDDAGATVSKHNDDNEDLGYAVDNEPETVWWAAIEGVADAEEAENETEGSKKGDMRNPEDEG